MNKEYLKNRFPMLMLIFAFGGLFGFIYEEIFYRFDLGEWVKRGTTFGPWIPIYGFGAILILGLTYKVRKNPFLVCLLATIASGVLELATGWVILTVWGIRLWDYNEEILNWGNIGGFVCARSVLFFGISVFNHICDDFFTCQSEEHVDLQTARRNFRRPEDSSDDGFSLSFDGLEMECAHTLNVLFSPLI